MVGSSPIINQGSQPFPDHQSGESAAPRSANPQVLVWAVRIQAENVHLFDSNVRWFANHLGFKGGLAQEVLVVIFRMKQSV